MATQAKGTIKFRKYKMRRKNSAIDGKVYARALHDRTVEFDDLVRHVANHGCPFSEGTIKGVMVDALSCLKELILDGKSVRLGDLGLFSVGLDTKQADSFDTFTASENITGVHLNVLNTKTWGNKELKGLIKFEEDDDYNPDEESGTDAG